MTERSEALDFYIRRIARILHYKTEEMLSGAEITDRQGKLLGTIARSLRQGLDINRKALQEAMHLSGPSITSLLNGLEKKGFIKRGISPEDARALDIQITEKGIRQVDAIWEIFADQEKQLVSGMTEQEVEIFSLCLKRAYENILK